TAIAEVVMQSSSARPLTRPCHAPDTAFCLVTPCQAAVRLGFWRLAPAVRMPELFRQTSWTGDGLGWESGARARRPPGTTVAGTAYAHFGFLHEGICVFTRKRRAALLMAGAALAAVATLTPLSASASTA